MKICLTCGHCCLNTEMQLSEKDILRIEQNHKLDRIDFCVKSEGLFQLKNVDQHCFFLEPKDKTCKIYMDRPTGCGFYPLIFDEETNKCQLDKDCPYWQEFYRHVPELKKRCKALKEWIHQELLNGLEK
jgi:uncharacterized protein